jgi:hypothetical protein
VTTTEQAQENREGEENGECVRKLPREKLTEFAAMLASRGKTSRGRPPTPVGTTEG